MLLPFIFIIVLMAGLAFAARRRRAAGLIPISAGCAIYILFATIAKIALEALAAGRGAASIGTALGVYALGAALVYGGVTRWLVVRGSADQGAPRRTERAR